MKSHFDMVLFCKFALYFQNTLPKEHRFRKPFLKKKTFTDNGIGKIMKGLDPIKAHGHGMMSIRMLKM